MTESEASLVVYEWMGEGGAREELRVGPATEGEETCLRVVVGGGAVLLPMSVLVRVMERYGKPLEDGIDLSGPSVDLGEGGVLRRIRHRGFYDVIARDFIVWEPRAEGSLPLAEMATAVSAALAHFARAVSRSA